MPGVPRFFAIVIAAALLLAPAQTRAADVDLQLVLAIDSSSSVSMDEYYLQLDGYAAAFRHPELLKAIRSGGRQAVAVTMFEWSGPRQQQLGFEWRVLDDAASLEKFAAELQNAPRLVIGGETAIGNAIDFAVELLDHGENSGGRQVVDISGDGASNQGRPVTKARDDALFRGIVINGLAVLNEEPDVDEFYRRFVVGGPGAFVIAAHDYTDFSEAILKKLVREITTVAQVR